MTPKTRYRKWYIASKIAKTIKENTAHLSLPNTVETIKHSLQQLGLLNHIAMPSMKNSSKKTSHDTKLAVWNFWHSANCSTESTLTSRPAKLRFENRPAIQSSLLFVDTVKIERQRGVQFFVNPWKIINKTIRELLNEYNKANPMRIVSQGVFHALKPFYIRSATTKDLQVFVDKKYFLVSDQLLEFRYFCVSICTFFLQKFHFMNTEEENINILVH